jgi:hypothetical protein
MPRSKELASTYTNTGPATIFQTMSGTTFWLTAKVRHFAQAALPTYPEASVVVVPPEGWLTDICDMHSSMTATRAAIRPVSGDFRIIIAAIDWQSGSHHFETAPM